RRVYRGQLSEPRNAAASQPVMHERRDRRASGLAGDVTHYQQHKKEHADDAEDRCEPLVLCSHRTTSSPPVTGLNLSGDSIVHAGRDPPIHGEAAETSDGMIASAGSSSGCQSTPRAKSPSPDSIASTLSSSTAHALAVSCRGITSTP